MWMIPCWELIPIVAIMRYWTPIKQQGLSIDLIVATGDLVQDQSFAAYQHFC